MFNLVRRCWLGLSPGRWLVLLALMSPQALLVRPAAADVLGLPFTIDAAHSYITLQVDIAGALPVLEQAPGSMTSALSGAFLVNLLGPLGDFTDIELLATPFDLVGNVGPFLPGNASADFAGQVDLSALIPNTVAFAVFRDTVVQVFNTGAAIDAAGDFPIDFTTIFAAFNLDYDIQGMASGSAFNNVDSLLTGTANLQQVGDQLTLVIPIDVFAETLPPELGFPVNYHFLGQIVATAVVPEPSSLALLAAGSVALGGIALRRWRRATRGA